MAAKSLSVYIAAEALAEFDHEVNRKVVVGVFEAGFGVGEGGGGPLLGERQQHRHFAV